jgi:uncharacterized membrane protein YdjX (TVP38/TMEM64 family)
MASSLPLGLLWFSALFLLVLLGVGLVPALVGFPILASAALAAVLAARFERWRVRLLLGTAVPAPYRPPRGRGPFGRLGTLVADPALWRDLAYAVALPLVGLAELLVVLVAFALPWPLLTYPLWFAGLPEGGVQLGPGEWLDTVPEALLVFLLGLLLAAVGLLLVRLSARAHVALALALLGAGDLPRPSRRAGLVALGAALAAVLGGALLAGQAPLGQAPFDLGAVWETLSSPGRVRAFFGGFGALAPAVFFLLQAAQVVVSLVPAAPVTLAGVAAFGPWAGFALALSGAVFGSLVAFLLGRRFGRPMVARLVGEKALQRGAGKLGGLWILPVMLLPLPVGGDAACALAGLSQVPLGRFLALVALGRLPGTALNVLLASGLTTGSAGLLVAGGIVAALLAGAAFLYARRGAEDPAPENGRS